MKAGNDVKAVMQARIAEAEAKAAADRERIHDEDKAERREYFDATSGKLDANAGKLDANAGKLDANADKLSELTNTVEKLRRDFASSRAPGLVANELFGENTAPANRRPLPDEQKLEAENAKLKARARNAEKRYQAATVKNRALVQEKAEESVMRKDAEEKLAAVTHTSNPKRNPEDVKPRPQLLSGRGADAGQNHVQRVRGSILKTAQEENAKKAFKSVKK